MGIAFVGDQRLFFRGFGPLACARRDGATERREVLAGDEVDQITRRVNRARPHEFHERSVACHSATPLARRPEVWR